MCTTGVAVAEPIWVRQPMLPAAITSGLTRAMLATLRSRKALAIVGLQDVVSAGRAAAEMRFGDRADVEAGPLKERPRRVNDLLGVLERAGGVIGDGNAARSLELEVERARDFRDVLG